MPAKSHSPWTRRTTNACPRQANRMRRTGSPSRPSGRSAVGLRGSPDRDPSSHAQMPGRGQEEGPANTLDRPLTPPFRDHPRKRAMGLAAHNARASSRFSDPVEAGLSDADLLGIWGEGIQSSRSRSSSPGRTLIAWGWWGPEQATDRAERESHGSPRQSGQGLVRASIVTYLGGEQTLVRFRTALHSFPWWWFT
jgi:hypothetical protein